MKTENAINVAIISLRAFQMICIGLTITGFIWATSDLLLTTVLVEAPVTPLSVLLMLYGSLGTGLIEIVIRWLTRKQQGFLSAEESNVNG